MVDPHSGSTVVDDLTQNPEVVGLNPLLAPGREKLVGKTGQKC
jgi:hypothetical protein